MNIPTTSRPGLIPSRLLGRGLAPHQEGHPERTSDLGALAKYRFGRLRILHHSIHLENPLDPSYRPWGISSLGSVY